MKVGSNEWAASDGSLSSGTIGLRTYLADVYYDDVKVRRLVSPEPAVTPGSEEGRSTGGEAVKYYYAGSKRIAMRRAGTLTYIFSDHLGSTSVTLNASTGATSTISFYPFGGTRAGSAPTDYQFQGQNAVASTGLYQMGARWYDAGLGRWISPDTIVPSPRNPQMLNRLSFVGNNPLRFIDPTGHVRVIGVDDNGDPIYEEDPDGSSDGDQEAVTGDSNGISERPEDFDTVLSDYYENTLHVYQPIDPLMLGPVLDDYNEGRISRGQFVYLTFLALSELADYGSSGSGGIPKASALRFGSPTLARAIPKDVFEQFVMPKHGRDAGLLAPKDSPAMFAAPASEVGKFKNSTDLVRKLEVNEADFASGAVVVIFDPSMTRYLGVPPNGPVTSGGIRQGLFANIKFNSEKMLTYYLPPKR